MDELGERFVACVNDEEIFDTAPENPVDIDLAVLYPDDTACTGVNKIVFHAYAVAKDNDYFVSTLGSDQRLKALDPGI